MGRWLAAARESRPVRVTTFAVSTVAAAAGAAALALLVIVPAVTGVHVFGGNSGGGPAAASSPSRSPYSPPRVEIAQAYYEYNRVQLRTARTNNPAPLDKVMTGRALRMQRQAYAQRESAGKVGYGSTTSSDIRILDIKLHGNRRATLHTCQDRSGEGLKNARSGEILTVGREKQEVYTEMRRVDGQWKVSLAKSVEGGGDCA